MMACFWGFIIAIGLFFSLPTTAFAANLQVSGISIERPLGASCYALRGEVLNNGSKPVVDTDVFAQILDASGEPVLQNRTRVGSIGDVPPGSSPFALRLAVPAGTPGPLKVSNAKAKGFNAPVRARAAADVLDLLPLEQELNLQ